MSYDAKIASARSLLEAHNVALGEGNGPQVNIDQFLFNLRAEGATTEEGLGIPSWEELKSMGLPLILAKQVAQIFRSQSQKPASSDSPVGYVGDKKAQRMTVGELVDAYDPRDAENAVGKRLREVAKGKAFVVFNKDGSVNIEGTKFLLNEIRDGYPQRDFYDIKDGRGPVRIYSVGDAPNRLAEQNPLFREEPLRPDGTCSHTGQSWNSVSLDLRRLIYIARYETREIQISDMDDAHDLIEKAVTDGAEEKFRKRYPQATMRYEELSARNELPSLRTTLGGESRTVVARRNDPFNPGPHKRY